MPGDENLGAGIYLDPEHSSKVVSGVTPEEQATATPVVAAALARYRRSPEIELFDLQSDPHEWINLADEPDFAATKRRLTEALLEFRTQTHDPFLDPQNVADFRDSQHAAHDLKYRLTENHRWAYLDAFSQWRLDRLSSEASGRDSR